MNELRDLCGGTGLGSASLSVLRERCAGYAASFQLVGIEVGLIVVAALLGGLVIFGRRVATHQPRDVTAGNTIEAFFYGGLGAYAGSSAGLLFAQLAHPVLMGLIFGALAVVALAIAVMGAVRGDGSTSWKALGVVELFVFAVVLAVVAGVCFAVPAEAAGEKYASYLNAVALFIGAAGALDGVIVAGMRGANPFAGWLLVPVNASWGALGNLLGLMHHMASFNFYAEHGKPHAGSRRRFYVCYEDGFRLKPGFAFTAGSVMTSQSDELRNHEAVHVLQHLIFGPMFPLSYVVWAAALVIPGLIGGAKIFKDAFRGATQFSYYNNPWEVIAYGFGGDRHDGDHGMIFRPPYAWTISVVWILGTVGLFAGMIALRGG